MPTIDGSGAQEEPIDEAELADAAFVVRYQGRTLDAYRYDLRAFFQWAADERLVILSATRAQIELYVPAMEGRGLAATTSTAAVHIAFNPAQYVRRPKLHPNDARGLNRSELGRFGCRRAGRLRPWGSRRPPMGSVFGICRACPRNGAGAVQSKP